MGVSSSRFGFGGAGFVTEKNAITARYCVTFQIRLVVCINPEPETVWAMYVVRKVVLSYALDAWRRAAAEPKS